MSEWKTLVLLVASLGLWVGCGGGDTSIPLDGSETDSGATDTATPDTVLADTISDAADVSTDITAPPEITDIAAPDIATPDIATPDIATPDIATPDTATPDTAMVDTTPDTTPPPDPGCVTDSDCDDQNLCSTDKCTAGGKCFNLGIEGCCNTVADCKEPLKPCETWECTVNLCTVDTSECIAKTANVTTVSGFNLQGYQDGPIETAMFGRPWGMTVDNTGVIYVTDLMGHTVRAISNGQVTTVAGGSNTQQGKWTALSAPWTFGGNVDGPVETALFNMPSDVLVDDATGTIYVLDMFNQRLKQIQNGMVTTIAGGAGEEFADGPAATATFKFPTGLTFAPDGGLYIADAVHHRIRHLSADKSTVTTVAGSGAQGFLDGPALMAQFDEPYAMAVDGAGNLIITDYNNQRIRKLSGGMVTTFAGSGVDFCPSGTPADKGCTKDGSLLSAAFASPIGIVAHSNGTIYVTEQVGHTVRSISGGSVETLAGTGEPGNLDGLGAVAQFKFPIDIVEHLNGSLWLADDQNQSIREISFD